MVLGAPVFAGETNSISSPAASDLATQSVVNGYLQIQAQLHDTQLAIEKNREEAAAAEKRDADAMAARLQKLEDNLAVQRAADNEMAQKNLQMTLILAVAFGLIVVAAVLFMAYLQWRAVARLVELSARRPPEISFGGQRRAARCPMPPSSSRTRGTVRRGGFRCRNGFWNWNKASARRWREKNLALPRTGFCTNMPVPRTAARRTKTAKNASPIF